MSHTGLIGDIHLDLAGLRAACDRIGAIAGYVVTGDVLDRGPDSPSATLAAVADLNNGHLLCGNHELVYLGGPRYPGMFEDRCAPLIPMLRDLVIDGRLRAAAVVGDVLCTHGGVTRTWSRRHLSPGAHNDPHRTARELNRLFLRGVMKRDFSHPIFAALESDTPGPFWASCKDDLLADGTPDYDQVVGHVPLDDGWHQPPIGGRVLSVCRERAAERTDSIGYTVLEGTPS